MYCARVGQPWAITGQIFNAICLIGEVTRMTEERMLENWPEERKELYREYQRCTCSFFMWPPKANKLEQGYELALN